MPLQEPSPTLDDSTGEHQAIARRDPPRVVIRFGALTDTGKVRGNNEDHFLVARLSKSMQVCKTSLPGRGKTQFSDEEGYLMVVADGMGGAAAGERASALAVESVEAFVLNTLKWFLHLSGHDERRAPGRASPEPRTRRSDRDRARPEQSRISRHGDDPDDGLQRRHRPVHRPRRRLAHLPVPRGRTRAVDQRPHARPGP